MRRTCAHANWLPDRTRRGGGARTGGHPYRYTSLDRILTRASRDHTPDSDVLGTSSRARQRRQRFAGRHTCTCLAKRLRFLEPSASRNRHPMAGGRIRLDFGSALKAFQESNDRQRTLRLRTVP